MSALLNMFKLVCGPFGQSIMHVALDFCPDQSSKKGIESTKAKYVVAKVLLSNLYTKESHPNT